MSLLSFLLRALVVIAAIAGIAALYRQLILGGRSRERLLETADEDEYREPEADDVEAGTFQHWLALAGFRSPGAVSQFIGATLALFLMGLILAVILRQSGVTRAATIAVSAFPGVVGELFLPVIQAGPWIGVVIMSCLPWLVVRSARRRIVTEVEQDLPLILELLATLGESGLGFDSAIARIVSAQPAERPLTVELRGFQRETLTGRPRVEAMRRLARRLDVPSLTIFISAVVQAEQVGAGVASVLRRQADDVRDRRRDRAIALAQALPVKLLFPLVSCFLPAIFVITLGPVFVKFLDFAEVMLNHGGPR